MLIEDARPGMYIKSLIESDYGVITDIDSENNYIWAFWLYDKRRRPLFTFPQHIELVREDEYLAAVLAQG